jgi:Fe-S-cluster-containing dehydrogenase component
MARYGIVVDVEKCTGCYSCYLACTDEFVGNDYLPLSVAQPHSGRRWINLKEVEQGTGTKLRVDYIANLCQHCENPVCASVAPAGAVYRRKDGIVIIDPVKAQGCREIVDACPYGVISWNPEKNLPQKCTMCAHMLDNGEKTTRCAEVCPTGALVFGNIDDADSPVSKVLAEKAGKLESLKPEFGTRPSVKYISLPKVFIAGEILLSDKLGECARGVKVTLEATDGSKSAETVTDFFGDFEFKNLESNKEYTVKAELAAYLPRELTVRTFASQNVGELVLEAR